MSGGAFDYDQYRITNIADEIEKQLQRQGQPKPKEDFWHGDDSNYVTYSPNVQERFKEAVYLLRKAAIYAQRIDWYLSGDDGEESFLKRLDDELQQHELTI